MSFSYRFGILVLAIGLLTGIFGANGKGAQPASAAPPDFVRVFVTIPGRASAADASALQGLGAKIRHAYVTSNVISLELPASVVAALSRNPRFSNVRVVPRITASEDQLVWGVDRVEADRTWGGSQGAVNVVAGRNAGAGVKVAVIDTGIDQTHPDLQANLKGGTNFVDETCTQNFFGTCLQTAPIGPENWDDDNGHGSHVAGVIGAVDNGSGVIGVAPGVDLYAIKALDYVGSGFLDDAIAGLEWASGLNGGVKVSVVNMSFGCDCNDPALQAAVDNAYAAGVLLVGAAGNNGAGADTVSYPAHYDSVVAVGATCGPVSLYCGAADQVASFSSTGPSVALSAPGDTIKSTFMNGGYTTMSGTSMAAPHVTGAAALVFAANPGWSAAQVRQRLTTTAQDLGLSGRDSAYGFGLVNAYAASLPGGQPNNAPVAQSNALTVKEDTSVAIPLQATDADGDSLSFSIVTPPAHGTLSGSGASRTYKAVSNYFGADSFTFKAYDGIADSNVATVSITVTAANDAPKANPDSAETPAGTPVVISVLPNDTDADGDVLTLVSAGPASSKGGTAAANPNGTVTYTPPAGFKGIDTFTYKISDGHGGSSSATVSVAVGPAQILHIGDLDGAPGTLLTLWRGVVTVMVHDANENPVAGATVLMQFSNGLGGQGSCKTAANGVCTLNSGYTTTGTSGVGTVTKVTLTGWLYLPAYNHDPDGSSNGTSVSITR